MRGLWARLVAPVGARGSPTTVVMDLAAQRAVRSGILWGFLFGVLIASSEITYGRIYKTAAQRAALAATYGTSKAMSALFGPAPRLETVRGFTVFKISMTLMILGAVWGLFTGTRLLRGEEDSGRWDLLLCGQTTRRGATAQTIAGLGVGLVTLWILSAAITVLSGQVSSVRIGVPASLYFALAMVATAAMFLAVGALTSQLAATRRQANAFGAVLLGVSYALRLVADAGLGLHTLIWTTPLGWVEELQPFTTPRPLALLPIAALTTLLAGAAVRLAETRDAGASIVADRAHARAHLGLVSGPGGLSIRLMRATVIGWWVILSLSAFLYGLIARSAGATVSGSVREVFSKLGATGSGADAVLGVCFLIEAILIGFMAAGQVNEVRAEESGGTLDNFVVRPVSRATWLAKRLLLAVVVLVLGGVAAGLFAWFGAASQRAGLSLTRLLGAGVNLVPPAVAVLGIGVLALGICPRVTSIVVYTVLGWSLLIVIVGGFGTISHWVLDTSVFHHMAAAPGVAPDWEANGIMTAVGVVAACVGGLAFIRRDLQGP